MAKWNDKGEQIPDDTPVEIPVGFQKPEDLQDMIRRLVRNEAFARTQQGVETFQEAEDFDVGDEPDLTTPYQHMAEERPADSKHLRPPDLLDPEDEKALEAFKQNLLAKRQNLDSGKKETETPPSA